jgi:transposase
MSFDAASGCPEMDYVVEAVRDVGSYRRIAARSDARAPTCERCGPGARMSRHGCLTRQLRDIPQEGRPTWLSVQVLRWRCSTCGQTATPAMLGVGSRRRLTQRLIDWLVRESSQRPASQLAREAGVDEKTVRGVLGSSRRHRPND